MIAFLDRHHKAMAAGFSDVLFTSNPAIGVVLFFATFFNPGVSVAGIVAVMAAHLFACFINFDLRRLEFGCFTFNPLLSGMAIGYVFKLSPMSLILMAAAGILTFIITILLSGLFYSYMKLPVLSLPFVITTCIMYMAVAGIDGFSEHGLYPGWEASLTPILPLWLRGFFESFGMIYFLPHAVPGIIIAGAVLFTSRILFMTGAAGYFLGTFVTGILEGSLSKSFGNAYHFNFIIIAMALGGVFTIPSLRSYAIAAAAVCIAAVAQKALAVLMAYFGLTVLALPFNLITLLFLYALGSAHYKHITKYIMPTPEETLGHHLAVSRRFKKSERTIRLPFSGEWMVWQGFDGEWTHKGEQKYAYDFIIAGENGESHANGGGQLSDYYAYQKPVLSPVRGYVVKVSGELPDNPIGQVDKTNTWGNFVIISDERGFFIAMAHLKRGSIQVREGDWVERGAFIGKCGNSGYSPQPHLHVQAQKGISIASGTLPFSFASYTHGSTFTANGLPVEGDVVAPQFEDISIEKKTSFMIGDRFRFEALENGAKIGNLALEVKSASDGTFYFDSGRGILYFGKIDGVFYTYRVEGNDRLLETMFMALPSMPLSWRDGLTWNDFIPANMAYDRVGSSLLMFASSFHHNLTTIKTELTYMDQDTIEGKVVTNPFHMEKQVRVELDSQVGFKTIIAGDIELRRLNNEAVRG